MQSLNHFLRHLFVGWVTLVEVYPFTLVVGFMWHVFVKEYLRDGNTSTITWDAAHWSLSRIMCFLTDFPFQSLQMVRMSILIGLFPSGVAMTFHYQERSPVNDFTFGGSNGAHEKPTHIELAITNLRNKRSHPYPLVYCSRRGSWRLPGTCSFVRSFVRSFVGWLVGCCDECFWTWIVYERGRETYLYEEEASSFLG